MAKTFESDQDREEQEKVIQWIETYGKPVLRTDKFATVDALVHKDGKPEAVIEIKRRYSAMGKEDPFKISASKIEKCKLLAGLLRTEFKLVVQWDDCIGVAKIGNGDSFYTEAGGRPARDGSANDWEIMAHIPLSKFQIIQKAADE